MSQKEQNAYILGTDDIELFRLGLQHQIWSSEAQLGWQKAQFAPGQTILDLGCGPGFCTTEIAFIAGPKGKVIGIDRSQHFVDTLNQLSQLQHLNIDAICADFNEMTLAPQSIDRMYCRWAMAWIDNPIEILTKVYHALKPGGKMVIHEYFDWSTLQTEPNQPHLSKAIAACLKSFSDGPGDINVGRYLPQVLEDIGMGNISIKMMHKVAQPGNTSWEWPNSFFHSYFPRLVEMGYMDINTSDLALNEMNLLKQDEHSMIFCPVMIEVIAEKI